MEQVAGNAKKHQTVHGQLYGGSSSAEVAGDGDNDTKKDHGTQEVQRPSIPNLGS